MTKKILINGFVIVVALFAGVTAQQWLSPKPASNEDLTDLHKEWEGKVVMLNFWATWCPPCKKEIPDFVALQSRYANEGLQVVGAALDTPDMIAQFIAHTPINYPNFILEVGEGNAIMEAYGNQLGTLPFTVFIDRTGNVVETHYQGILSYEDAEDKIKKIL